MAKQSNSRRQKGVVGTLRDGFSLTCKMVLACALLGVVLGVLADRVQYRNLQGHLEDNYSVRLHKLSVTHRQRFDLAVNQFASAIRLICMSASFQKYLVTLEANGWRDEKETPTRYFNQLPFWMPHSSIMRSFIRAKFIILQDSRKRVREAYIGGSKGLPVPFTNENSTIYHFSQGQVLLSMIDQIPFIVITRPLRGSDGAFLSLLTIARPIDEEFFQTALGLEEDATIVALISAIDRTIVASNQPKILPVGTSLLSLRDDYLIMKDKFFDYGNSDLLFEVATILPRSVLKHEYDEVLKTERWQHFGVSFSLVFLFSLLIYSVTRRVRWVTQEIIGFQRDSLGVEGGEETSGDEIVLLKNAFVHLTREVLFSRAEMERTSQVIRKEKERAQLYLDNAGVLLAVLDTAGNVVQVNKKGCEILAISEKDAIGKNVFSSFVPKRLEKEVRHAFQQRLEGTLALEYSEYPLLTSRGDERMISFHNSIVQDEKGGTIGVLCVGEDVTEKKWAEDKIQKYAVSLEKLVDERTSVLKETQSKLLRQEKLAAIGKLSGSVAHDLRNPLGVISNSIYYIDLIQGKETDERVKKHFDIMENEINRANEIISELMDFSRENEPNFSKEAINPLLLLVKEKIKIPANFSLKCELDPELPSFFFDVGQIERVLLNLIHNAVQSMPDGGKINITTTLLNEKCRVSIQDEGRGIAADSLARIFEPLFTTKSKGVGLGLSIVKTFVEKHHGTIDVESVLGQGTQFVVTLPINTNGVL